MSEVVLLRDAPGGSRLIESLTAAARDFSLLYAGTPDHAAQAHLKPFCVGLESDLAPALGANTAADIAARFLAAVLHEKRRLETTGASGA